MDRVGKPVGSIDGLSTTWWLGLFVAMKANPDGCWEWPYGKTNGYGRVQQAGRPTLTHRIAYERFVGAIPDGLTLDHLCRVRACLNPAHLEAVTTRVNILRGEAPSAINARKATCKRGHPLAGANLYAYPDGSGRECRICRRTYHQRKEVA